MFLEKGHGRVETALEWEQSARCHYHRYLVTSVRRQHTDVTIGF